MIAYVQRLLEPTTMALCFKHADAEWGWTNWQRAGMAVRSFLGDHSKIRADLQQPLDNHRAKLLNSEIPRITNTPRREFPY